MGSEPTYTVGWEWDDPLFSPLDIDSFLAPDDGCDLEDHQLRLDESAGHIPPDPQSAGHISLDQQSAGNISPDPQSAGDTRHSTIAGLRDQPVLYPGGGLAGPTAVAENLPEQDAHPWYFDCTWTSPGLTQPATYSIIGNAGRSTGTGMAEPHSWSPLSGFNMREINAVLNPTAAVKDVLSAENPLQEPRPPVVNAMAETDPYYSHSTIAPLDPQSAGDNSHSTIAGLRPAVLYDTVGLAGATSAPGARAENLPEQNNAHPRFGCPVTDPGLVAGNAGNFTGTGMPGIPHSWSAPLDFNMVGDINAALTSAAAVSDNILLVENLPPEPAPVVVNAGLVVPEPELDPYSTAGHISPDPQSAGHFSHSTFASLRQAVLHPGGGLAGATADTGAEDQHEHNAHACLCCPVTGPGLTQPATYPGPFAGTGMVEIPHSGSAPPLGFNILSAENFPQEPTAPLVFNAVPDPDRYSTGDSSCPPIAADTGSSSLDLEVNAWAGLSQSGGGGGALTEAVVPASCKRKKLVCGSSSQRSAPPEFNLLELRDVLIPFSTDIQPPTGSTDEEILDFLRGLHRSILNELQLNLNVGKEDQICPKAVRSYVTTVEMMPDQKTRDGYWEERRNHLYCLEDEIDEIDYERLRRKLGMSKKGPSATSNAIPNARGLKRTLQFHKYDGTKTNWFMDEYIPTDSWGSDLYMEDLRFREVYKGEEISVPGDPTSPKVKISNKIAAAKRHRTQGPENKVNKRESRAWQHFIKIYDKHPELQGSKVVYAVCSHCKVVLKAGTENGTRSLLTHCDHTCPVKNKKQQPSSSSPDSTGDTSCLSTAADTGSSQLDQDFNAGASLRQSGSGGGGALGETPVRASCKRKKLVCGSSSQMSTPPEHNLLVELLAGLVQSDTSSTDIKPPTGSTDVQIIRFLEREDSSMPRGKEVNLSLGEQDQMAPEAVRSYVTTVKMMPGQNPHDLGSWKEKEVKHLRDYESDGIIRSLCRGLKRTLQFHKDDGTKTKWFMHEYIPTDLWGRDLFMKHLRFREVFEGAEVPGEPTSPEGKIKNKNSAAKKHRMRGPENMVIEKESQAWQHFIKIYDKHPELEGSKVVYAVCCHCEGVLKAGTGNGTKSLLTHCDRTCPVKNNKNQQPSSSSYQENCFGILVGVGVP